MDEGTVAAIALVLSLPSLIFSILALRASSGTQVSGAFNQLILAALPDPQMLTALHNVLGRGRFDDDDVVRRERIIAHYMLNTVEQAFLAGERGMIDESEGHPITTNLLASILATEVGLAALMSGQYDKRFVAHAEEVLKGRRLVPNTRPRADSAELTNGKVIVRLRDQRTILLPVTAIKLLPAAATQSQLANVHTSDDGDYVTWPDLKVKIATASFLA